MSDIKEELLKYLERLVAEVKNSELIDFKVDTMSGIVEKMTKYGMAKRIDNGERRVDLQIIYKETVDPDTTEYVEGYSNIIQRVT